jgi:hypothetical protein
MHDWDKICLIHGNLLPTNIFVTQWQNLTVAQLWGEVGGGRGVIYFHPRGRGGVVRWNSYLSSPPPFQ